MSSAETFWGLAVNFGDSATDKADAFDMNARFTTTNKFLTEELEQSPEMVWAAKRRTMMDVWIG